MDNWSCSLTCSDNLCLLINNWCLALGHSILKEPVKNLKTSNPKRIVNNDKTYSRKRKKERGELC